MKLSEQHVEYIYKIIKGLSESDGPITLNDASDFSGSITDDLYPKNEYAHQIEYIYRIVKEISEISPIKIKLG